MASRDATKCWDVIWGTLRVLCLNILYSYLYLYLYFGFLERNCRHTHCGVGLASVYYFSDRDNGNTEIARFGTPLGQVYFVFVIVF